MAETDIVNLPQDSDAEAAVPPDQQQDSDKEAAVPPDQQQDSDAEAAVPPDQQSLIRAGCKAENVSGDRGLLSFFGALAISLVAVALLYVAVVFSASAARKRRVSYTEPIKVNNPSVGAAARRRNVSPPEPIKANNSSLGAAARRRNASRAEQMKVNNSSLGAAARRRNASRTEQVNNSSLAAAFRRRNASRTETIKVNNSSLGAAARKPNVSRTEPIKVNNSSLGAAVCVLGQMARLEIESKVQNIIKPLSTYTNVDVFMSLETGDHGVFFAPRTADASGTRCRDSELDVDGVKEAFAPYFKDGVFGPPVGEDFSESVTLQRWPELYKYKYPEETASDRASRSAIIASDFGQMRHQKVCAELIQKSEESAGGKKYDVVVKVRDDTIALRPVAPEKLVSVREVTLKQCQWWGGVNDKVMALPREYLESSLGAIYPSMLAVMNDDPLDYRLKPLSNSRNTEQLVMFTLLRNNVPFRQRAFEIGDRDGDDYLPFVDGRCSPSKEPGGEGRWCIVSHCKDCWPSMPWTYNVTCEVAVAGLDAPAAGSSPPSSKVTSAEQTIVDPDPERECKKFLWR